MWSSDHGTDASTYGSRAPPASTTDWPDVPDVGRKRGGKRGLGWRDQTGRGERTGRDGKRRGVDRVAHPTQSGK